MALGSPTRAMSTARVNIYAMDANGGNDLRLTDDPRVDRSPAWSPDGMRIVFVSSRGDHVSIYVMEADGGSVRRLTNDPATNLQPTWSPDGNRIAFSSDRHGGLNIYVMDSDGKDIRRLTDDPDGSTDAAWSPGGTQIAYTRYRGKQGASISWRSMAKGIGSRTTVLRATRCGSRSAANRPSVAVGIGCPLGDTMSP